MKEKITKKQIKATKGLIKWIVIGVIGYLVLILAVNMLNYSNPNVVLFEDIWFATGYLFLCMFTMLWGARCLTNAGIYGFDDLLKATGYKIVKEKKK